MLVDFDNLSPIDTYRLMIQTIVPRPVAWILSQNENSTYNLAPFSYFNAVCSKPPLFSVSIGYRRDKSKKDTRTNIEREKAFVLHIASGEHAAEVTKTGLDLPVGESEVDSIGAQLVSDFARTDLPRLAHAKVAMHCTFEQTFELGANKQGLVIGRIQEIYADDSLAKTTDNGIAIDIAKLGPLGRLGGDDYALFGEIETVPRPEYTPY